MRLVKKGPLVPARIWLIDHEPDHPENILDTGPILQASIGEKQADPLLVWERGRRIDREQYEHMMRVRDWAFAWAPDDIAVRDKERIDLSQEPSLF